MNAKEMKDELMAVAEKLDKFGDSISGDVVADAANLKGARGNGKVQIS